MLHDVHASLYDDIEMWHSAGFVPSVPLMRPYTYAAVERALLEVLANDQVPDHVADRAGSYLAQLRASSGSIGVSVGQQLSAGGKGVFANTTPSAGYVMTLADDALGSTRAELRYAGNSLINEENQIFPYGYRNTGDRIPDNANFEVAEVIVALQQYVYSSVSRTRSSLDGRALGSFSAGIHRSAVGPDYRDGIILSDQTPAAANFILGYDRILADAVSSGFQPRMDFGLQFMLLGATDDLGGGRYGFKYMFFHHLTFDIAPWISLGFVESVISGNRFDPIYLVPISSLFLSQGINGFRDNSLLGFVGEVRLPHALSLPFSIYADDISFNDLVRFEFDTKYKLALQTAVEWTPLLPWVSQLALDYTAVMPYMYTHFDGDSSFPSAGDPNYSNYTHRGTNIGPGLEPNSDRLVLAWHTSLGFTDDQSSAVALENIDLYSALRFIRHGNASAGIIPDPSGTGTIFDPGYIGQTPTFQAPYSDPTGQPYTRFLTQDVIERVLQLRLESSLLFRTGTDSSLSVELAYTFEHIWNAGLVAGQSVLNNYVDLSVRFFPLGFR
jgi:hypothetical protein